MNISIKLSNEESIDEITINDTIYKLISLTGLDDIQKQKRELFELLKNFIMIVKMYIDNYPYTDDYKKNHKKLLWDTQSICGLPSAFNNKGMKDYLTEEEKVRKKLCELEEEKLDKLLHGIKI